MKATFNSKSDNLKASWSMISNHLDLSISNKDARLKNAIEVLSSITDTTDHLDLTALHRDCRSAADRFAIPALKTPVTDRDWNKNSLAYFTAMAIAYSFVDANCVYHIVLDCIGDTPKNRANLLDNI